MVSPCSRSVCSLRLFSCSSFPFMLASSLVMVLSDCARSDDDGSGAVAPVVDALGLAASGLEASNPALLSVSLPAGGAGTVPGSSAAASCTAGGFAGLSNPAAFGGGPGGGGGPPAQIDFGICPGLVPYCETEG